MRFVAAAALAAGVFAVASPPAAAADATAVATAIKKGGEFLRERNTREVNLHKDESLDYGLGGAALSGLAMLEAGVKPDDAAVKNVAQAVRTQSLSQTNTYHISLCVLFLDRLGEKEDVPLLQYLGVRLYAGMNAGGGWGYKCWEDVRGADAILKSLQTNELTTKPDAPKPPKDPKDDGFFKPDVPAKAAGPLHPEAAKLYAEVQKVFRQTGRQAGTGDDNSNTQFGIVGLWVAARHGVPAKDAFALIEARFVASQGRDGGWSYNGVGNASTVAMTCAGLLGLAVGRGSREAALTGEKEAPPPKKGGTEDDPFYTPKKGDGEKGDPLVKPKENKGKNAAADRAAEAGLKVVAGSLAAQQGPNGGRLKNFVGIGTELYTLWSVERVAVAYSLDTLGGVDWYDWGAGIILPMQQADGSFNGGSNGPDVNTSFAILFLAKSNFTRELGTKKGKDPGKGELRGGGAPPLLAPAPKDPPKSGGTAPANPNEPLPGGFSLPKVAEPTEQGEAEKVAKALVAASDADWPTLLAEARDTKGGKWTRGLVLACGKLDGDKRYQAREALADRLTRMTAKTLRDMLRDPEIELRRAACLACGMKDDRGFAPDLIGRLSDPSEYVVRAARASLKSLAGGNTDFGPTGTADEEGRLRAAAQWTTWFEQQGKK